MFSEYEQEKLRVLGEAAAVLAGVPPSLRIRTFGDASGPELEALVELAEESGGAASTARAVLKQRAERVLSGVPEHASPFDCADALMGHVGVSSDLAMALVEELR